MIHEDLTALGLGFHRLSLGVDSQRVFFLPLSLCMHHNQKGHEEGQKSGVSENRLMSSKPNLEL